MFSKYFEKVSLEDVEASKVTSHSIGKPKWTKLEPREAPMSSRGAQHGSREVQEDAKGAQGEPKGDPRRARDSPKRAKGVQMKPKRSKNEKCCHPSRNCSWGDSIFGTPREPRSEFGNEKHSFLKYFENVTFEDLEAPKVTLHPLGRLILPTPSPRQNT